MQWGIPIHRGLGKTGLVGVVHGRDGGACGRAVGLRADMDALPMQEHNHFAHASRYPGKMHACGHDGHTAMLLAAAQHLAQHRDFDGTVYLIFQPAEEGAVVPVKWCVRACLRCFRWKRCLVRITGRECPQERWLSVQGR